jgi:nucleoside diphosphate kinase
MADEPLFDAKQINIPFTIGIIKPDVVLESEKLSQVISFIENSNLLTIKNMFQRELMREEIINLFYKHESKPYFEDILKYMGSGECCVMVLVNAENS